MSSLSKEQIDKAVRHGLMVLSGEVAGVSIPYHDDVFILKQFLVGVATGQIALSNPPAKPPEAKPGKLSPPAEPKEDD
jgi:hypothetical protein